MPTSTLEKTEKGEIIISDTPSGFAPTSPPHTCKVGITIKTLLYESGDYFYDISYSYCFSSACAGYLHPFSSNMDSCEGDIIAKNSMTEEMVRHLLMDDEALTKVSGHTCPVDYRKKIMRCLALLWD